MPSEPMTTADYEREVQRTAVGEPAEELLGLVGEAGEVADLLKKVLFHGRALDRAELVKEMGDAHWYWTAIRLRHGISLDEVVDANVAKLRKRYPDGWTAQASAARVDVAVDTHDPFAVAVAKHLATMGTGDEGMALLTNQSPDDWTCAGCRKTGLREAYMRKPLGVKRGLYCSPRCLLEHGGNGGPRAASAP